MVVGWNFGFLRGRLFDVKAQEGEGAKNLQKLAIPTNLDGRSHLMSLYLGFNEATCAAPIYNFECGALNGGGPRP